jgi:hypothetical protein
MRLRTILIAGFAASSCVQAMDHGHDSVHGMSHETAVQVQHAPVDGRTLVHFPDMMRLHILTNMRDHLLALSEIQSALGDSQLSQAAEIAEQRLGMSSLKRHGAHDASRYMPPEMAKIGNSMHRAASRFAATAQEAEVTGDMETILKTLAEVTQACVACHNGFRVH